MKETELRQFKNLLGLKFNEKVSFSVGISHPVPDWFRDLSDLSKTLWLWYARFGDLLIFLVFVSNFTLVMLSYDDLRILCTCTGTMLYVICLTTKLVVFRKHKEHFGAVITEICTTSADLTDNPVQNQEFLQLHHKYYGCVKLFGYGKITAIVFASTSLTVLALVRGLIATDPKDLRLQMEAWMPYKTYENPYFSIYVLFEAVAYPLFLLKDVAIDLIFLAVLVIINTQLIFLRKLLGEIVAEEDAAGDEEKYERIKWWIKQHQLVLKSVDDFKIISNPYLFAKYITVSSIFFLAGVLLTSNAKWDMFQQLVILNVNFSNLLQLYIFSMMGDAIHENGIRLAEEGYQMQILTSTKRVKLLYLNILTRSTKPVLIKFGEFTPLAAQSFLQIVKLTFSYFVTIVQIQSSKMEDEH